MVVIVYYERILAEIFILTTKQRNQKHHFSWVVGIITIMSSDETKTGEGVVALPHCAKTLFQWKPVEYHPLVPYLRREITRY